MIMGIPSGKMQIFIVGRRSNAVRAANRHAVGVRDCREKTSSTGFVETVCNVPCSALPKVIRWMANNHKYEDGVFPAGTVINYRLGKCPPLYGQRNPGMRAVRRRKGKARQALAGTRRKGRRKGTKTGTPAQQAARQAFSACSLEIGKGKPAVERRKLMSKCLLRED